MPEPGPSYRHENLMLALRSLLLAGLVCVLGSVVAYATGDELHLRGEVRRTHLDAAVVLGTLGVALLVVAAVVHHEVDSRGQAAPSTHSDRK